MAAMLIPSSENATNSFHEARSTCLSKVNAIIKECRRLNVKYNDPSYHLPDYDTLASLAFGENPDSVETNSQFTGSVKRIEVSGPRIKYPRR